MTNTQPVENKKFEYLPRSFGRNTKLLVDFFTEGKKGKSVVFATPEGNFLSPKAVENAIAQARQEERKGVLKFIKDQYEMYEPAYEPEDGAIVEFGKQLLSSLGEEEK